MKRLLLSVMWFMLIEAGNIYAQTETGALYKKHTFEVAPEVSYITYTEPGVLKESGVMYGLVGSYTYHNRIMLKVEGRFTYGKLDLLCPRGSTGT
jgi:hypothetical protein